MQHALFDLRLKDMTLTMKVASVLEVNGAEVTPAVLRRLEDAAKSFSDALPTDLLGTERLRRDLDKFLP